MLACAEDAPRYPQPTYIDYTREPPAPSPSHSATQPVPSEPTIGDALAPFGIVLPAHISLLKLPPPSAWQNWPFTWPNLPQQPEPVPNAGAPAPNPSVEPDVQGWTPAELEVLHETNRHRAAGASCGNQQLPPAPALEPSLELQRAARAHSVDMAGRGYFDHTSPDGRSVDQRTRAAGYPGAFVGENIAAGRAGAQATVSQWMASPGHCLNIMEPKYRFLGVGYASNPSAALAHFWTQNFGG